MALLATRAAITASLFGFSQAAELLPSDGIPLDASLNSHQSLGGAQLAPSYEGGLDERNEELMPSYQPEIGPFGRSIIGRASPTAISMSLSLPMSQNIQPNGSTCFVLSSSAITDSSSSSSTNGRRDERQDTHERRADSTKLYLSGTTCLIPGLTDDNEKSQEAPQLQLVVSTSQSDGCPTSTDGVDDDMWIAFDEGMGTLSVDVPEGSPVYIGVVAPKKAGQFSGVYNAEVAASTSGYYHQYDDFASDTGRALLWMDSDSSAALLVSHNLTDDHSADKIKEIMNQTAPYELFVQNNASPSLKGMQRSLCGMEGQALISANSANTGRQNGLVTTSMTTRGAGGLPKQQFYFEGLNQTSSYTAVLVKVNSTSSSSDSQKRQTSDADRSYTVYSPVQFSTLSGKSLLSDPSLPQPGAIQTDRRRHDVQSYHRPRLLHRHPVRCTGQRRPEGPRAGRDLRQLRSGYVCAFRDGHDAGRVRGRLDVEVLVGPQL